MNLAEYLNKNKIKDYVITDRVRTPVDKDIYKYLDFTDILVNDTEIKKGITYIYTDYIADSC